MRNMNAEIKSFFYTNLKDDVPAPVYIDEVPQELLTDAYISIEISTVSDNGNINSSYTNVSVSVKIYTKEDVVNSGEVLENIATKVYDSLMPNASNYAVINNKKCYLFLVSDVTQNLNLTNKYYFKNRFINFELRDVFNN